MNWAACSLRYKVTEAESRYIRIARMMTISCIAAIRDAFKTPEVIRMFANKEPDALRGRLESLESDLRLGRMTQTAFNEQAFEVVSALSRLENEVRSEEPCDHIRFQFYLQLRPREREILESRASGLAAYTSASPSVGTKYNCGGENAP